VDITTIPAHAFKEVDPIAYNQEYLNWLDSMVSDGFFKEENDQYYHLDPNEVE